MPEAIKWSALHHITTLHDFLSILVLLVIIGLAVMWIPGLVKRRNES
jgi:hypothetical protein